MLSVSTCDDQTRTNSAYIPKLHFISKYSNRSVETVYHEAGGIGSRAYRMVKKHYVHFESSYKDIHEYMILKVTKVI